MPTIRTRLICPCLALAAAAGCTSTATRPASRATAAPVPSAASSPDATAENTNASPLASRSPDLGDRAARDQTLRLFGTLPNTGESDGTDAMQNLRQVSFAAEGGDSDPSISPDGSTMYFSSTAHRPKPDIYMKSIDGRAITQLTNDPASDSMPAVSPNGKRLAFASDRSGSWDVFVMDATGGQAIQITTDSTHELHPTWSPDGRWLAYCKLGEVSGRWEVWVCDADTGHTQRFLTLGLFPDWHPIENRIAFQRSRDRGDRLFSIWTLDYVKGEARNLTEIASSPEEAFINPRWSRDGEFVAFASVPNPRTSPIAETPLEADILVMKVSGGGIGTLTGGAFTNLMPAWGPGDTVYFTSDRTSRPNIWSVDAESAIAVANGQARDPMPIPKPAMPPPSSTMISAAPEAAPHRPMTPPMPMADAGALPAPSQTEPEPAPEIANVPIDDR